jgi:hypothetical protein
MREYRDSFNRKSFLTNRLCLLILFSAMPGMAQRTRSGITLELRSQSPPRLHVTLRSLAKARTAIYKSELPWELRQRIILVAVLPDGEHLDQNVVAGDPSAEKISLNPNESVSGEIDLMGIFKDLDTAIQKSDVHLFWAYRSPAGLGLPKWSGGWILLPQQNP